MSAVRGGCAWVDAVYCRSSVRGAIDPGYRSENVSFRTKAQPAEIIVRGGSCVSKTARCRAAIRFVEGLYDIGWNRGFRTKTY